MNSKKEIKIIFKKKFFSVSKNSVKKSQAKKPWRYSHRRSSHKEQGDFSKQELKVFS